MTKDNLQRDQRIQDPVHGIIDFHPQSRVDRTAWRLLQTADFQRLRRIKQLGAAEYVFPSATHSRFAHSVGVFHSARRLVERIRRESESGRAPVAFNPQRAESAEIAALLHDLGHGPFSHVFEQARQDIAKGRKQSPPNAHESFSAAMITSDPIRAILAEEGFDAGEIAEMICTHPPADMYHAIVSGTFDADRLDYMMRDRHSTGIGEGGFDTNWIMDNIRIAARGDGPVLCLAHKAITAAEEFLLARYYLRKDMYFHKTIRGIEQMLRAFFVCLAESGGVAGLPSQHPLARFLIDRCEDVDTYRRLDDMSVWSALHSIAEASDNSTPPSAAPSIARRILIRKVPQSIDVTHRFPAKPQRQIAFKKEMAKRFGAQLGTSVFFDSCTLSIYDKIGKQAHKQHESLLIQLPDKSLREITELPNSILAALLPMRHLERYYFLDEQEYRQADRLAHNWRKEWR